MVGEGGDMEHRVCLSHAQREEQKSKAALCDEDGEMPLAANGNWNRNGDTYERANFLIDWKLGVRCFDGHNQTKGYWFRERPGILTALDVKHKPLVVGKLIPGEDLVLDRPIAGFVVFDILSFQRVLTGTIGLTHLEEQLRDAMVTMLRIDGGQPGQRHEDPTANALPSHAGRKRNPVLVDILGRKRTIAEQRGAVAGAFSDAAGIGHAVSIEPSHERPLLV